jgi:hypothetical protein
MKPGVGDSTDRVNKERIRSSHRTAGGRKAISPDLSRIIHSPGIIIATAR